MTVNTDVQALIDKADGHARKATIKWETWRSRIDSGVYTGKDYMRTTEWGLYTSALKQARDLLNELPPTPVPVPAATRLFADASAFNKPIPANPAIHPDSALMISQANNWLLAGTAADPYKEWLGARERLLLFEGDFSGLALTDVYVNFVDFQGYACGTVPRKIPIPSKWAQIIQSGASYDGLMWIADTATGTAWEGYRVTPPGMASMDIMCGSNRWNAVRMDNWPNTEKTGLGYGLGKSGSGSGIQVGLGLMRPSDFKDLSAGSVIPHALRLNSFCGSNGANYPVYVSPATSGDGIQARGIPMGARVQLDPSVNVDTWPSVNAKPEPWRSGLKKMLRTLQVYGCVGVDSSGAPAAGGLEAAHRQSVSPYVYPWDAAGAGWGYGNGVPYDLMGRFRVVDWRQWAGA